MQPTGCLRDLAGRLSHGGGVGGGFGWCSLGALLPRSNLVPFGRWWHTRGRGHCNGKSSRAQQHAQAYHGTLYRMSELQIRRGWRGAPSSTSRVTEPLCTRIKGANREVSEGKLISEHGLFSS